MKEKLCIPLVTDNPKFEWLGEYLAFGASANAPEDPAKKALFRLGLPLPSAQNLRTIPLEKILRFREDRRPERLRLQAAVDGVMSEADKIDDPNRLNLFWKSKKGEVETAIQEYQRSMRISNLVDFASLFKVCVPTGVVASIAYGANFLGATGSVLLTTAAFAVDALGWWASRKIRKQGFDQKFNWQYALMIREQFGN